MNYHEQKCKDCAFFFALFGQPTIEGVAPPLLGGQCRKSAPVSTAILIPKQQASIEAGGTVMVPAIERVTTVPHVSADYWCGEFQKRAA